MYKTCSEVHNVISSHFLYEILFSSDFVNFLTEY